MSARIFLLSPASCAGNRARLLLGPSSRSALAERLRTSAGAPIGDVFTFISQLYFRGKLAYARAFARVPADWNLAADTLVRNSDGVFVITTSRGLVDWRQPVTAETLREFAAVELKLANEAYIRPLEASARNLASRLTPGDEVVLLGSIASDKYVTVLTEAFGSRLRFPQEFAGRGDMSRGGLMLRRVAEGRALNHVPLAGSPRHGVRPPKLDPAGRPPAGGGRSTPDRTSHIVESRREPAAGSPSAPSPATGGGSVDQKTLFLKFWEKEGAATRKVLSRIPEGSDYRPDPKSRTAREIAHLIVREEIALADGLEKGFLEWIEVPAPPTMKEVLDSYDQHHDDITRRLQAIDAARWEQKVPFMYQGQEVMSEPGYENAWGFLLDMVHHRGQLSTSLRPMGAKVPQIYGPSADEPM